MHGNQGIVNKYYAQIEGKNEVYHEAKPTTRGVRLDTFCALCALLGWVIDLSLFEKEIKLET